MNKDSRIHTYGFKLHNVEIESSRIDLAADAWIEKDATMVVDTFPSDFGLLMALTAMKDREWGLNRWATDLLASDIIIRAKHTEKQGDEHPFELHDASYIAIALSIQSDAWFVSGIEYHTVTGEQQPQPSAPWTTMFSGINEKAVIRSEDETTFQEIYTFVYEALCQSTRDERKLKLLSLFLGCLVKSSGIETRALKAGFPTSFSGQGLQIIFGAMFFEHIFTRNGWDAELEEGVKKYWNKSFPRSTMKWEDIKIIHKYRHTLVHDDAQKSRQYVEEWQRKNKVSDVEFLRQLESIMVSNVKRIMRTIALNYGAYTAYRKSLPH